ncbi:DUF221-domain-containing protein [Dothidotthia symphoricarpi CBS 119687]|uniref:DUF221-domain-containing protein n=1 Tax=Dothidotthia symphoricarpi CBS 119687 TaxID=1392245 RepID=A0A6A6ARL4_9PLEO|nr:DUF221-domain-containing protein [Dothidotthia symphoricarpi CBS 119687]KAF2133487.1 DUF221-domain-containing protein [Dothidotthia symphoricarpi CBS 119687]
MASPLPNMLFRRDSTVEEKFEQILSNNPLGASVSQDSVLIAIGTSLVMTAVMLAAFMLLRPHVSAVYAPRLRHADEKHRPPPLDNKPFAWYHPIFKTNEDQYMHQIGLDATIFLRFGRMCRNMFLVLSVVGCAIIVPVNVIKSVEFQKNFGGATISTAIFLMTPRDLFGEIFWAFVALAYVFDVIVCGFLWWNYRAVHRLRRKFMESPEYQNSLHSRTLMITDIKKEFRSDHGIVEIIDSLRTTPEVPRASIGRNVKDIPDLIEEHEKAVIELEAVLAKYLKNPKQLPASRPQCMPSKKDPEFTDKKQKVDAIDYLTARIQRLEAQIKLVRETVDKRDAMSYGFASYESLESAHSVAFSARSKHPKGTTIQLALRPKDIIWKNLPLTPGTRRRRRFINRFWIVLLTLLYFIPNAIIAVFLSKLTNIALLLPAFQTQLGLHPTFWAIIQGLVAPALTSLIYFFLPIIFRRLSIKAGDVSRTSRERHVISQLYVFFVFNNLFMFSLFGATFGLIFKLYHIVDTGAATSFLEVYHAIDPFTIIMQTLCEVSPFWITWLVQRNLGAAVDLVQLVNLAWGTLSRKLSSPTPRDIISWTAPPPFDYTGYYNYFLFYSTVALCFASLQPVTLIVTALYFTIDSWMKKYLLMYVFCTKNESGGVYWRVLFNRMLAGLFLSNCLIALMVLARGYGFKYHMLAAMVPLPLCLLAFKFYCKNAFDNSIKYYTKGEVKKGTEAPTIDKESRKRDRVAVRFGHPALYQKLTVPMVREESKHLLAEIYRGRLDGDVGDTGFSDVYHMKRMSKDNPGKAATTTTVAPFEFVSDSNMDFENFKNRPEFSDDHGGGDGSLYGGRPGTPTSTIGRGRASSRDSERTFSPGSDENGVSYPAGYHHTPSALREYSPSPGPDSRVMRTAGNPNYHVPDQTGLLAGAAPMGNHTPSAYTPYSPDREAGQDYFRGR